MTRQMKIQVKSLQKSGGRQKKNFCLYTSIYRNAGSNTSEIFSLNPVESNSTTMKVAATFCALIICFSSAFGSDEWTCVGYPKAFCKLYSYVCPGIEKSKTSDEPVCGDFNSCSLYIDTLESTYDKNADGLITKVSSALKSPGRQNKFKPLYMQYITKSNCLILL